MKQTNKILGHLTETIAADYLAKQGFQIVAQNVANRFGEIDIIAKDHQTLVFVEVKAKTGINFGLPEEMITPKKLAQIRRMADLYLQDQRLPCRIDVVAIVLDQDRSVNRLTHYRNVY